MIQRDEIVQYLNTLLNIAEFQDHCINGLQVEGKKQIQKIVLGVSVSERLFRAALQKQADMIIVHHGLFWKNDPSPYSLTGIMRNRLALLLKNDINLLAYHLPLDAHPEIGNNAQILKRLQINPLKAIDVGFLGELPIPIHRNQFVDQVNQQLQTTAQIYPFGSLTVHQILVISGGSSPDFHLAVTNQADTFLGGDIRENIVRMIEEAQLNFIQAGHYNTEKPGVQALGKQLEQEFKLSCEFVDVPNPV